VELYLIIASFFCFYGNLSQILKPYHVHIVDGHVVVKGNVIQ